MDAGLVVQQVLVALAVLTACAYVVRRQCPHAVRRARMRLALLMVRPHRAAWVRRLGRRLAPAVSQGAALAACGQSGSCGGCAPG